MISREQFEKDLQILKIDTVDNEGISKRYVTAKYKNQARVIHPDKPGGDKEAFQELLNAYRRVIKYLEENNDDEADYEAEFFKRHKFMKQICCLHSKAICIPLAEDSRETYSFSKVG